MRLFVLIVTTLLVVRPAPACVLYGPGSMSPKLPTRWESKSLVARVQPLKLVRPDWAHDDSWRETGRIRVRVIEALRGFNEGQIFVVRTGWEGDRCGRLFPNDKAKFEEFAKGTYYVGGDFRTIGGFAGQDFRVIGGEKVFLSFWRWEDYK
ncbi:hypothetical protein JQ633_18050 [Bradyrhizobium tropiciagri]|uniref:hypothetical protein n=1 Tax=Bradyrhizobium tropiciagri TaxID=312253 RepID=UPI001BA991C0|nr:hypothetical protein [Bradyrhizobium tropiciagri]MBR0872273.1 hypothetical protein [Bradyrhizobium tropiciagri]